MPTIPPARTLSHRPAAFVARALMAVLASLTVLPAASTAEEPVQPFTVRFERFGIADGLSQSSVSAIARDARGFLWIGTREGLDRYDGYEFVTYRPIPDDPLSLTGGSVVAIATDAQGDLWIATTSGGVDRYDVENDVFEHHPLPDFGPGDGPGDLLALVASRTGTIWIGTSRGLLLLDPTSGKPAFEEVLAERVQALAEDRDGQMLVATGDGALLRLSTGGERVARWELGTPARALAVGAAGDIWAGLDSREFVRVTSAGIEAFVLGADAAPGGARIRDIAFDRGGHLWLAGLGMGVVRFDPVSGSTRVERLRPLDPFSLSNNDAVSLLIDSDDRLWVGTLNGGLNRASLAPTGFAHYWHQPDQAQTLSHPAVTSFAAADDGVLWIGTDGGGLNRLDLRSGTFDVERANREAAGSIPDDRVWSLALDSRGALWVGTWGGGLATRSVDADAFASIDALPGRIVTSLRADHDSVWAGTADAGLAQLTLDGRLQRTFRHDPGDSRSLSADNVTVVHVDQRDRLWVGTWNAGLNRLDPDAPGFVRYRAGAMGTGGLPHDSVRGIAEQPDGTLWFATAGGVARLGPQARSFESVTAADGLPEGTIYAAVPDPQGHLWLTTNRGIVRYSPATGAVRVFGPGDGAQAYEFNGGASLALPDGRIAFGGINGFNLFRPSDVVPAPPPNPVTITQIRVLGQALLPQSRNPRSPLPVSPLVVDRIEVPHSSNVLEIRFVSPLPHDRDQQRFAYRLDGFDQNWRQADAGQRSATYTNLEPGSYVFRVRSANGDGVWSRADRTLAVTVTPPWWATPYAWAAYGAIALLTAFALERRRTFVLRRRAAVLREQVRRRTSELAQKTRIIEEQASRLREALATKERLFARVSHEFRTPLTLVLGPVDALRDRERDPQARATLGLIERNARRLLRLVDDLLGLAGLANVSDRTTEPMRLAPRVRAVTSAFEPLAARKQLEIVCPVLEDVWVPATEELIERILTNLVANAVKYSPGPGRIDVSLEDAGDWARLTVSDAGPGITPAEAERIFEPFYRADSEQTGTGLGLALVRESAAALGGDVTVVAGEEGGATFIVRLPVCAPADLPSSPEPEQDRAADPLSLVDLAAAEPDETARQSGPIDRPPSGGGDDLARILVIEDNADLRELVAGLLGIDHECRAVASGEAGLELAFEEIPDLVVCDVMMQGIDGFEVTRRLKTDPRTSHVPVVLLTALGDRSSRLLGLEERADDYIVKPFDPEELRLRVRNLIETRRIARRAALREHVVGAAQAPEGPLAGLGPRDRAFLERFEAVVAHRFDQAGSSTADLAREVAMSERQLQRKLRALLDTTPADYLREYRLTRAAQWLLEGRAAGTVALDAGFATQSHFTECFKARFGVTPGEYAASRQPPKRRRRRRG